MPGALSRGNEKLRVGAGVDPVHHARQRILGHLRRHPEGVPKDLMFAWLASVTRHGGLGRDPADRYWNYEKALKEIVRDGLAVCTNGVWWLRRRA